MLPPCETAGNCCTPLILNDTKTVDVYVRRNPPSVSKTMRGKSCVVPLHPLKLNKIPSFRMSCDFSFCKKSHKCCLTTPHLPISDRYRRRNHQCFVPFPNLNHGVTVLPHCKRKILSATQLSQMSRSHNPFSCLYNDVLTPPRCKRNKLASAKKNVGTIHIAHLTPPSWADCHYTTSLQEEECVRDTIR